MDFLTFLPFLGSIINKVLPDKESQDKAKLQIMQMAQEGELAKLTAEMQNALGQIDLNKAEATTDLFRGGWRPAVGWVCVIGFAVQFIIAPIATFISTLCGHSVVFPSLDIGVLMNLLFGMLGLSWMRTKEKLEGVVK